MRSFAIGSAGTMLLLACGMLAGVAHASDNPEQARGAAAPAQIVASLDPRVRERALAQGLSSRLLVLVNQYRERNGLQPLRVADDLAALAAQHSAAMSARGRASHDGFMDRFDRAGSRICVENVAVNFPHAEALLDGWRGSAEHHRNLLEPQVTRVGLASSKKYVTFFACG